MKQTHGILDFWNFRYLVLIEFCFPDGIVLPAGLNVFISPYVTHRLPHIYPNPEIFDPDRFSTENIDRIHPYSFIPFSIGPRMCIGKYTYDKICFELKFAIFFFIFV